MYKDKTFAVLRTHSNNSYPLPQKRAGAVLCTVRVRQLSGGRLAVETLIGRRLVESLTVARAGEMEAWTGGVWLYGNTRTLRAGEQP